MTQEVKQQGSIAKRKNEIEKKKKPETLKDFVQAMSGQIAKALPKVITPERFTRIAMTALSSNPQLAGCDRNSFLGSLMQAAQLGLEPNTPLGQAYLIPFRNKKKGITECQFQVGYKGLIDLAYRSGDISSIYAECVYENDEFDYEYGLERNLVHKPARTNRGKLIYVYAVFKLKDGGYSFTVASVEDVINHAKRYSQGYNSGYSPWKTNFEEMAKKTVLKQVLKYAPIRTEFATGIAADEATVVADDELELHTEYQVVEDEQQDGDTQGESDNPSDLFSEDKQ